MGAYSRIKWNHRRSRDCEREISIECLRWKSFRDNRWLFGPREISEAKLNNRLNSGRLKPKAVAESGVRGNDGDLAELPLYREGSGPFCDDVHVSRSSGKRAFGCGLTKTLIFWPAFGRT